MAPDSRKLQRPGDAPQKRGEFGEAVQLQNPKGHQRAISANILRVQVPER